LRTYTQIYLVDKNLLFQERIMVDDVELIRTWFFQERTIEKYSM